MLAMFTVLTGLGLPESPRWHDGRLWVADWTAGRVCAIVVSEQHLMDYTDWDGTVFGVAAPAPAAGWP